MQAAARQREHSAITVNEEDYFRTESGVTYAGMHLLIDLWGCENLDDPAFIERALSEAATAAGATILHAHTHHFSPYGGVTGVLVLSESHISIHTWPEKGYAAIDVFMCGACEPRDALPILKRAFQPESMSLGAERRGASLAV
ncbi:MAG: adenosylmethionine decarboxylase [Pseudomonadota bacterium]